MDTKCASSEEFHAFITNLLTNYCKINSDFVKKLTTSENMKKFLKAFTSSSYDAENNYEHYEKVGDNVLNYSIHKYWIKRFPVLKDPRVVGFLDKLEQTGVDKASYSQFADSLGFRPFIRASTEDWKDREQDLLEDVFEGFAGCLEYLVDENVSNSDVCAGGAVIYQFAKSVLDKYRANISLKRRDIWDAITLLQELTDHYNSQKPYYHRPEKLGDKRFISRVDINIGGNRISYGGGNETLGKTPELSKAKVAKLAFTDLTQKGYIKPYREVEDILGLQNETELWARY